MTPDRQTLVSPGLVAPMVVVALLAEAVAWGLAARTGTLGPGFWYGRGDLLAAVHLATVGTLAMAIVGTGWQLVPVVTAKPPGAAWSVVARAVNAAMVLGLIGLVTGFLWHGPWLVAGAILLVGALLVRSVVVVYALVTASQRWVVRGWLLAAEGALLAGITLAAVLAAERAGASILSDRIAGIGLHAALLLAGWVGGWMIALGSLLLPMFAVSPEPRPVALGLAGLLWFGGLFTQLPALWAAGAVVAVGALLHSLSRRVRRRPDAAIAGAAVALMVLLLVAGGLVAGASPPSVVAIALLLWALPFFRGVALRIVPFLTWVHLLGELGPKAPPVASLLSPRLAAVGVVSGFVAGLAVLLGAATQQWALAQAGAVVGMVGALSTLVLVGIAIGRATRHRHLAQALPGMEAS